MDGVVADDTFTFDNHLPLCLTFQQLAASVYCRSESAGMQRMCVTVNSDAFDIDSAPGPGESDTADPVRTPRVGTWEGGMIKGQLTGKSAAVKRPEVGEGNKRSGERACQLYVQKCYIPFRGGNLSTWWTNPWV